MHPMENERAGMNAGLEQLCAAYFAIARRPARDLLRGESGFLAYLIEHRDMNAVIAQNVLTHPDTAFVLVEFGAIPAEREHEVWSSVLQANFILMGGRPMGFARDAAARTLVFYVAYELAQASGEGLYRLLEDCSAAVAQWRVDYGDCSVFRLHREPSHPPRHRAGELLVA